MTELHLENVTELQLRFHTTFLRMSTNIKMICKDHTKTTSIHLKVLQPVGLRFWKANKLPIHFLSLSYVFIELCLYSNHLTLRMLFSACIGISKEPYSNLGATQLRHQFCGKFFVTIQIAKKISDF